MSIWVSGLLCSIMFNITYSLIFNKFIEKDGNVTKVRFLLCILFAFFTAHVYNLSVGVRSIVMLMNVIILLKLIFKEKWTKTLVTTFLIHVLCALSEMIFVVICLFFLKMDEQFLTQTTFGIMYMNIGIMIVAIILAKLKSIRKIMISIINWYSEKHTLNLVVTILIACGTILFLLYQNLQGINNIIEFIFNNIFIVGIIYFIACFFIEKSANNKIKNEYDNLLDYAKIYEQEVVTKSKWQHEYENQLLIIKDKIPTRNKEVHRYIDELLENKPVDGNSQWLRKLSKFPDIGIKGLLCYKIDQMQNKGIDVFVDVSDSIQINKKHSILLEKNLQDISRILGVYLDNAIDAAEKSTNKYLIFEVNCVDNGIIFQISNTFSGSIDLQKMGTERYTTKGQGHGYGLSLVKDILNKNTLLSQEREVNGMYYVQRLCIKK